MLQIKFNTTQEYIESLSLTRKEIVQKIRLTLLKHLDKKFTETISYNMIGFVVPFTLYPKGYHANPSEPIPFINLASQKQYIALYCMCGYNHEFIKMISEAFEKNNLKLNMGKSCIRIKEKDYLLHEEKYLLLIKKIAQFMSAKEWMDYYTNTIQINNK